MENHGSAPLPQSLLGDVITTITGMDSDGKQASQGKLSQSDSTIISLTLTGSSEADKTDSSFICHEGNVLCFLIGL